MVRIHSAMCLVGAVVLASTFSCRRSEQSADAAKIEHGRRLVITSGAPGPGVGGGPKAH